MKKKKIALLGSTGSIGESCLKVVSHLNDELEVVTLAVNGNISRLQEQVKVFNPKLVAVYDAEKAKNLQTSRTSVVSGMDGLIEAATHPDVDLVVIAIDGTAALLPTFAAIEAGKDVALATKEVLVSAGKLVMERVKEKGVKLLPIDSEHSALFQCLQNSPTKEISRLIITYSGGSLRDLSHEEFKNVTVEQALNHPNWSMGPKVTVDSSTLMNKGLELIEAHWLFSVPLDQIEVVVHPQSIVHGFVEFNDHSILAQMGDPDMITPIQYALTYPNRKESLLKPFDFTKIIQLDFQPVNRPKPHCLGLAYDAVRKGQSYPCYMNAANEVLVKRFLDREISWMGITEKLESLLEKHHPNEVPNIEAIIAVDKEARREALTV